MKFGLSESIYKQIKNIVQKYEAYQFKIFGSRARGNYKNNSDIDIAIEGNVNQQDKFQINNDFDLLDIPYTIDLVFIQDIIKKEFLEEIKKEGVEI